MPVVFFGPEAILADEVAETGERRKVAETVEGGGEPATAEVKGEALRSGGGMAETVFAGSGTPPGGVVAGDLSRVVGEAEVE